MRHSIVIVLAILALVLMGSSCEYGASVNNSIAVDETEANGNARNDGGTNGGLTIVVTSGDLEGDRVLGVEAQRPETRSRVAETVFVTAQDAVEIEDPDEGIQPNENVPAEMQGTAASVPALTPWGVAVLIGVLSGYASRTRPLWKSHPRVGSNR